MTATEPGSFWGLTYDTAVGGGLFSAHSFAWVGPAGLFSGVRFEPLHLPVTSASRPAHPWPVRPHLASGRHRLRRVPRRSAGSVKLYQTHSVIRRLLVPSAAWLATGKSLRCQPFSFAAAS